MKTLYDRISPYLAKKDQEALGESMFICDAVVRAAADRKISSAEAGWLRETVHDRLLPYTTLREYVVKAIKQNLNHLTYDENYDQFQAFRHRWLQHLCEEYEKQTTFDKASAECGYTDIPEFNDNSSHETVMKVRDKTIKLAKEDEK